MKTDARLTETADLKDRLVRVFTYGNAVGIGVEIRDEEGERAFDLSIHEAEALAYWLLASVACSKAGRPQ